MAAFPLDLVLHADEDLVLSRPTEADVDDLVAACRDAEIVRFAHVPAPYTPDHARHHVTLSADGAADGTALNLLARDADGHVLASCGLPRVAPADLAGEVGYWVAPWARRRGARGPRASPVHPAWMSTSGACCPTS